MSVSPRSAFFVALLVVAFVAVVSGSAVSQGTMYAGVTFPDGDASFADRVASYIEGSCVRCAFNDPRAALGPPDCGDDGCFACGNCDSCAAALGFRLSPIDERAILVLEFVDNVLMDVAGADLFVYALGGRAADVSISTDGLRFIPVGQASGYPTAIDIGPYVQPGEQFRFVRLQDVPWDEDTSLPCAGPAIDAVGALGIAMVPIDVGEVIGGFELTTSGELRLVFEAPPRNILIVLDTSSSMSDPFEGSTKIDIAKGVLIDLLPIIPNGANVALRAFQRRCETTRLIAPMQPLDRGFIQSQIATIDAAGLTPLAYNIQQARSDFDHVVGSNLIVLLSDGRDTCGGQPAHAARQLIESGLEVVIHVVGFDLANDPGAREQLEEIAAVGGGVYRSADTSEELRNALRASLEVPYVIYDSTGVEVYRGVLGDQPPELDPGQYRIVISTTPNPIERTVTVRPGEATTIIIRQEDGSYTSTVE
ncbi:MAG: VWA domain-containing protein [Candidatus Bipolaricaulota bacterium]|nr:MAG: VWA domain-containing protein [Candidatus Bipolaricaulota bacterium]